MNKIIKKIFLGLFIIFAYLPLLKADDGGVCKKYTNYYYFSEKTGSGDYGASKTSTNTAYLPLPEIPKKDANKDYSDAVEIKQVCIDGGSQTGCSEDDESWTKEEFMERFIPFYTKGDKLSVKKDDGKDYNYLRISNEKDGNVVSDILHVEWQEESGNVAKYSFYPANKEDIDASKMAASTVASNVTKSSTVVNKNYITFEIKRTFASNDNATLMPLAIENGENQEGYFDVALYKVTYTSCTYKATIDYFYENTTERVEFDDESDPNPYVKEELAADYEGKVESPKAKDRTCEPLDKSVDIKITDENGVAKDRNYVVYYKCKTADPPKQEETGDTLILIAWVIAVMAIGYVIYYSVSKKKKSSL